MERQTDYSNRDRPMVRYVPWIWRQYADSANDYLRRKGQETIDFGFFTGQQCALCNRMIHKRRTLLEKEMIGFVVDEGPYYQDQYACIRCAVMLNSSVFPQSLRGNYLHEWWAYTLRKDLQMRFHVLPGIPERIDFPIEDWLVDFWIEVQRTDACWGGLERVARTLIAYMKEKPQIPPTMTSEQYTLCRTSNYNLDYIAHRSSLRNYKTDAANTFHTAFMAVYHSYRDDGDPGDPCYGIRRLDW